MKYKTLENPEYDEAYDLITEALRKKATIVMYTNCKVLYEGRALSELDWFRFACILNDFENGYEIFDEFSQNYPTYNFEETRKKFENAKKYFVNCNTIKSTFSECSKCKHRKEY